MKLHGLVACACVAVLAAGCNSRARTDNTIGTAGTSGASGGVSNGDKDFVLHMLSDGMAEVETAQLAKERAAIIDVKQFAQMMIDDHTQAGDQLKSVAGTYAMPVDAKTDDAHVSLMRDLMKQHGLDFDKAYMSAMVDGHEKAVKALRSRVDEDRSLADRVEGKNPEDRTAVKPKPSDDMATMSINQWAANVLPTVEHHLDRARQIKDQLDHMKSE